MFSTDEILNELRNGVSADELGNQLAKMLTKNMNEAREKYETEKANETKKKDLHQAAWNVVDAMAELYELLGFDTEQFDELTENDIEFIIKEITDYNKIFSAIKKTEAKAKTEKRSDEEILNDFLDTVFSL